MNIMEKEQELIVFETMDLEKPIDVIYRDDTLWLSQKQIAYLFNKERSVISKHIINIFQTAELQSDAVCAFFAHTAEDGKVYDTQYYNLDMIISVGYRVNSRRGTQFRIWATSVLKDHFLKGYTINEKRLAAMNESMSKLKSSLALIERTMKNVSVTTQEMYDLVKVITDYSQDLKLLDDYDNQTIDRPLTEDKEKSCLPLEEVVNVIEQLKLIHKDRIFGLVKDNSLDSAINAIYQTFEVSFLRRQERGPGHSVLDTESRSFHSPSSILNSFPLIT